MRTRCPHCRTVFRITPEQLRARNGTVRCGHCQAIFNALESLIEEPATSSPPAPTPPPQAAPEPNFPPEAPAAPPASLPESPAIAAPAQEEETKPETEPRIEAESEPGLEPPSWSPPPAPEALTPPDTGYPREPFILPPSAGEVEPAPEEHPLGEPGPGEPPAETPGPENQPSPSPEEFETPEESAQAAREAGLAAVREFTEAPGYNRWSAGTLAASPLAGLEPEQQRAAWPFVVAAILLAIALALQAAYYFRTRLVTHLPSLGGLYSALGIEVPRPRQADLVSIESSDLQADHTRGLLVLQATLKNLAPYAQDWPALELTLTDARDTVVARRVLAAPDYLPPRVDSPAFPANGETTLRLWIEAREVPAAGYRLYVFYP